MRISRSALLASGFLCPVFLCVGPAMGQSGFVSPSGRDRYPGVTIFCPSGTGVAPCSFGGGAGGGTVTVNLGGTAVGATNRFPVTDSLLDGVIAGGALTVGGSVAINNLPATQTVAGSVSISGTPSVALAGSPTVNLAGGLPAGSNAIGSVSVSNFPATQAVSGSVSVSALPALPAGANAIGSVSVSNFPATQAVSAASLPLPAGAALDSDLVAPYGPITPAAATATKSLVVGCLSNTTLPSFTPGQEGAVPCDSAGRLYVTTVPSANNVPSFLQAVTAGGATPFSAVNAAASCMATNLKTGSGMVFGYSVSNSNSGGVWFRLFAGGTAPTCGGGTPTKRIYVPAGATVGLSTDLGWVFSGGIGFDVTAGSGADGDATTVAAANSVLVDVDYK
jgi:hypothetical protein